MKFTITWPDSKEGGGEGGLPPPSCAYGLSVLNKCLELLLLYPMKDSIYIYTVYTHHIVYIILTYVVTNLHSYIYTLIQTL